jgi:hypothetical protein
MGAVAALTVDLERRVRGRTASAADCRRLALLLLVVGPGDDLKVHLPISDLIQCLLHLG